MCARASARISVRERANLSSSSLRPKVFLLPIDLIRRVCCGSFPSKGNLFGETAACFLSTGLCEGAPPSALLFEITFDLFTTSIWALQRGCTVEALEDPSGSSLCADDMVLHSDGPDAIPAMRVMVNAGGSYIL